MSRVSKELEALNRIFNGMSNNVGYIKYFENIRQALAELEGLKRDVKRFMELKNNITNREEMDEFWEIDNKLSKVGEEDV